MDDILFRRTAIATPKDKSAEFIDSLRDDEHNRALVSESLAFDAKLASLLTVPVPDNLADKILLEQSFEAEKQKKSNNRWHIAVAASVAFVIGLSLPMLSSFNKAPLDIGEVAIQHVQHEYYLTSKIDEQATLPMINAKLASYGAHAKSDLGDVTFVNFCDFKGTTALHLVMKGEKGPVTVFVVPSDAGFAEKATFKDQHLNGITEKIGKTEIVIVGEKGEKLEKVQSMLNENVTWNI